MSSHTHGCLLYAKIRYLPPRYDCLGWRNANADIYSLGKFPPKGQGPGDLVDPNSPPTLLKQV
jgi:hypothetical protein